MLDKIDPMLGSVGGVQPVSKGQFELLALGFLNIISFEVTCWRLYGIIWLISQKLR